jgi:hypothetical protein
MFNFFAHILNIVWGTLEDSAPELIRAVHRSDSRIMPEQRLRRCRDAYVQDATD